MNSAEIVHYFKFVIQDIMEMLYAVSIANPTTIVSTLDEEHSAKIVQDFISVYMIYIIFYNECENISICKHDIISIECPQW